MAERAALQALIELPLRRRVVLAVYHLRGRAVTQLSPIRQRAGRYMEAAAECRSRSHCEEDLRCASSTCFSHSDPQKELYTELLCIRRSASLPWRLRLGYTGTAPVVGTVIALSRMASTTGGAP